MFRPPPNRSGRPGICRRSPSFGAPQGGVVLLHGIVRAPRSFHTMQTALEKAGFATPNLSYASRRQPLEALAEFVHPCP
jgi:hypothetical protein